MTSQTTSPIVREMLEEASDVKELWKQRNDEWAWHRNLINQAYRNTVAGYVSFATNEPINLLELAIAILAGDPFDIRLPVKQQETAEQNLMNEAEQFVYGFTREWDKHHRSRTGQGSWLRDLAWYSCMGGSALFPHLRSVDGELQFRCDLWDPMNVYPQYGDEGLLQCFRMYSLSYGAVRSMAKANEWDFRPFEAAYQQERSNKGGPGVALINRWWMEDGEVWNAIAVQERLLKPPKMHSEFSAIPIVVSGANGFPYRDYERESGALHDAPSWAQVWGRPITAANAKLWEAIDDLVSDMKQLANDHANPLAVVKTGSGNSGIGSITKLVSMRELQKLELKVGESFEWARPPATPDQFNPLLTYFLGLMQRGGLSFAAAGHLGLEISGVLYNQMIQGTKAKLQPYADSIQDSASQAAMLTMQQFVKRKGKVTLVTRNQRLGHRLNFFERDFEASRMPKSPRLEVTLPMALPDNRLADLTMIQMAMPGKQILDPITAYEQLGHRFVPDAQIVLRRLQEQRAMDHPAVQMWGLIRGFTQQRKAAEDRVQAGDALAAEEAAGLQTIIDQMMAQIASQLALDANRPNPAGNTPEARPQVQPPEASISPDLFPPPADGTPSPRLSAQRRMNNMGRP
jgi:hypothetical protein